MIRVISLSTLFAVLFCLPLQARVECGQSAPAFSLPSAKGGRVSLADYRGKVVVIEWFNHNCPFVRKFYDIGAMQKWQAQMTARGVVWLVVDSTNPTHPDYLTPEAAEATYGELHMAANALLLDPEGGVGSLYGATNTPQFFIVDAEGILVYQGAIDDRRTSDPDDVSVARNYVMEALERVLSGQPVSEDKTRPYGCSVKYKQ